MNKALGIYDNCDVDDECDMAGCKEMDDEDKDNFNSSPDHQDFSCSFCDLKIEKKADVTNYIERCDDAN